MQNNSNKPLILFIDLFCGAGGVSTGADRARILGKYQPVKLIACVNHDPLAIESHKTNHSQAVHFNEDIRSKLVVKQVTEYTNFMKKKYPEATVLLWASMECTNYSKAKGGMPRDADSRSLPEFMPNYIEAINPDYFYFENVEEFQAWGPLDSSGRPVSMSKGKDYSRWINQIKSKGYTFSSQILNCANFGAHTKRKRLFGIFAKGDNPIIFPSPTHSENPNLESAEQLKPWNPVRECLDFSDEGQSIFTRKKSLVEATLKRIYAGLEKYVANGDGVIITNRKKKIVFNAKYYGNGDNIESINQPSGTLRTKDCIKLVQSAFLDKGFSGMHNHQSIETPAGSIPTKDHYAVVKSYFLDMQYSGPLNHASINTVANTITANPKHNLVSAFIMNPQYKSKGGSIEKPCFTLIASMHKSPPSLVSTKSAWVMDTNFANKGTSINDPSPTILACRKHHYLTQAHLGSVPAFSNNDTPMMRKIKEFCHKYGIADITTRMLRVPELKKIQGFGSDYYLAGNQTDQKKFIGNSVPPAVVKAMIEALGNNLYVNMQIAEVA